MQIAICVVSVLLLSAPAVAVECKSELMGLTVFFYSQGKAWSITWQADSAHKKKTDYYGNSKRDYRTSEYDNRGNKRSERLPQTLLNSNKQFNVPIDTSQNGELLIAAIHDKPIMLSSPQQFAIVDLNKQKIVQTIETEYNIRSLAWALDDEYFAVLYAQDVTTQVFKGPLDWLGEQVGHPNSYYTFHLAMYNADGKLLCAEQVEKKLPNAISYIDWGKQ